MMLDEHPNPQSLSSTPLNVSGQGNCTPIVITNKADPPSPHWPELLISSTLPSLLVVLLILLIWRRSVSDIMAALSRRIDKGANVGIGPFSISEPEAGVQVDREPIRLDELSISDVLISYEG